MWHRRNGMYWIIKKWVNSLIVTSESVSKSFVPKSALIVDRLSIDGLVTQQPRQSLQQYADYNRIEMRIESSGRQILGTDLRPTHASVTGEKFLIANERRCDPSIPQQKIAATAVPYRRADSKKRARSQAEKSGEGSTFFDWSVKHLILQTNHSSMR